MRNFYILAIILNDNMLDMDEMISRKRQYKMQLDNHMFTSIWKTEHVIEIQLINHILTYSYLVCSHGLDKYIKSSGDEN